ncbi:MAG: PBECR4 domain-containing protein [Candidatus Gastranaerophilaceae bacterium]
MLYTVKELNKLKRQPKINEISLKLLADYYEKYLVPYEFEYILNGAECINLRFKLENFCHLLGIESVVKYNVSPKTLFNYRGLKGWKNVKEEKINFQHLKNINKKRFNNVKAKYVYFYVLPKLLQKPMAVYYNNAANSSNIECKILLYHKNENNKVIVHLGLDIDNDNYYFPRTFFVEKISAEKADIYIFTKTNKSRYSISQNKKIYMIFFTLG